MTKLEETLTECLRKKYRWLIRKRRSFCHSNFALNNKQPHNLYLFKLGLQLLIKIVLYCRFPIEMCQFYDEVVTVFMSI